MKSPQDKPATPISRLEKDFFQTAFDQSAVAVNQPFADACGRAAAEEPIENQGVRKWFESYKASVEDAGGNLCGTVGFARDISQRKRVEQHLALIDFALNQVHEAAFLIDEHARFHYVNDEACRSLGYSRDELLRMGVADLDPEWPTDCWSENWGHFKAHGSHTIETHHTAKNGRIFPVEVTASHFEYDGHAYKLSLVRDITERQQAEKLLRVREQEFRTLAENSPDVIVRYDRDCLRIFVNPAYEREMGIPLDRVLCRTFDEVWWLSMPHETYKARLQKVMETGVPDQIFLERQRPDGQIASYEARVVAEYDENGQLRGTLAIGRNITVLKQAERELGESRTQIRELAARRERSLEEERKRIARELHDELGQLLGVLHLQVQFLQARFGAIDPLIEEKTREIMNLVGKTQQVTRDITSTIRPAALSMGIVAALEWQAEELTRHTGIHCRLRGAGNDIQLDEERATALLRIVQEALTNVMRHSGASEVEVLLEQWDDSYALHIRDNGAGFDPDKTMAKKSFGLIGIRERALMLGGDVAITSAPQQGTLLQVRFPGRKITGDLKP